jgi:hypothetical protein
VDVKTLKSIVELTDLDEQVAAAEVKQVSANPVFNQV